MLREKPVAPPMGVGLLTWQWLAIIKCALRNHWLEAYLSLIVS